MMLWRYLLTFVLVCLSTVNGNNDDDYDAYDDDAYTQQIEICDEGLVQVSGIQVLCDSPYTYYYGNGANRNSPTCDYGDKATITVYFDVKADLEDDLEIYMTMGFYTDNEEELYWIGSQDLCEDYVGDQCIYEGSYYFTTQIQFSYVDGELSGFVPQIQLSFSTEDDGGYNLGGVNIECEMEEDEYIQWEFTDETAAPVNTQSSGSFVSKYGILLVTIIALSAFAVVLWHTQAKDKIEYQGKFDSPNRTKLIGGL